MNVMSKRLKIVLVVLGLVFLIPAALMVWVVVSLEVSTYPSEIIDFQPSSFREKADSAFFYSIGDELKYSDRLDVDGKTIFRGMIEMVIIASDNRKAVVVTEGRLIIVNADGTENHYVTAVDSIYKKPKPIGGRFFRDDDIQWSRDTKYVYLIRDEYYESNGSQLYSRKGELWRYELETEGLSKVFAPFQAYDFFFGLDQRVYFSIPDEYGNLVLKYFDGTQVRDLGVKNKCVAEIVELRHDFIEEPFYSFPLSDYERGVLRQKGVQLVTRRNEEIQGLVIRGSKLLEFSLGEDFKGPYYASHLFRSVFLPGDNYFLFNVYAGNFSGQLLIDIHTGHYRTLPKDTRVHLRMDTDIYTDYCVTRGGLQLRVDDKSCACGGRTSPYG